jgi:hypothetical protein
MTCARFSLHYVSQFLAGKCNFFLLFCISSTGLGNRGAFSGFSLISQSFASGVLVFSPLLSHSEFGEMFALTEE